MNLEHLHSLTNAELQTTLRNHPCYWDSSPLTLLLKELEVRLIAAEDEIEDLKVEVVSLKNDLDSFDGEQKDFTADSEMQDAIETLKAKTTALKEKIEGLQISPASGE